MLYCFLFETFLGILTEKQLKLNVAMHNVAFTIQALVGWHDKTPHYIMSIQLHNQVNNEWAESNKHIRSTLQLFIHHSQSWFIHLCCFSGVGQKMNHLFIWIKYSQNNILHAHLCSIWLNIWLKQIDIFQLM